jgi:ATP-dependent DNA helicase RecQ
MVNLNSILKTYFGYDEFRKGQEEIIRSIVNCNDTLVVMPTGGGKSLCYQLPSLVMPGTAIVISPLIALMKDQVDALEIANIPATLINSSLDYQEVTERILHAREGKYKLIYVAPERLESKQFISLLTELNISFIAVDEAHCISEWGHDFRPSYLNINKIFDNIDRTPVIALTATATPDVQEDIIKSLGFKNPNRFVRGFDRQNLSYITETTYLKIERVLDIISDTKKGSTIIYCGSRKRVEQFASELRQYKINAEATDCTGSCPNSV